MAPGGVSGDLAWWRAHRNDADAVAMRDTLDRLTAWKAAHDADRAQQGGFLRMAWDAIFSDEDDQVTLAIQELEDALSG